MSKSDRAEGKKMSKVNKKIVKVGSIWTTGDGKAFKVTKVQLEKPHTHTWVHYQNMVTGQEYSCYQDAFVARFFIFDNHVYNRDVYFKK